MSNATPADEKTLDGWLAAYADGRDRIVLDLDLDTWENGHSPFIVVRSQGRVFILNPLLWEGDHVCIDAHAFVDGTSARTGVFGMDNGARVSFPSDKVHGTSHGWPATPLVALMLGKQKEV